MESRMFYNSSRCVTGTSMLDFHIDLLLFLAVNMPVPDTKSGGIL